MSDRLKAYLTRLRSDARFAALLQFVKFGIVGLSNTLISLGVYYVCFYLLRMHYQLANVLSFLVSVTNAYYWNSRYVFHAGRRLGWKRTLWAYVKTVVSYGATFLLGTLLLTFWVEAVRLSAGIAPLLNLLFTIPLNFLLNKHWTFRHTAGRPDAGDPVAEAPKQEGPKPEAPEANIQNAGGENADGRQAGKPTDEA